MKNTAVGLLLFAATIVAFGNAGNLDVEKEFLSPCGPNVIKGKMKNAVETGLEKLQQSTGDTVEINDHVGPNNKWGAVYVKASSPETYIAYGVAITTTEKSEIGIQIGLYENGTSLLNMYTTRPIIPESIKYCRMNGTLILTAGQVKDHPDFTYFISVPEKKAKCFNPVVPHIGFLIGGNLKFAIMSSKANSACTVAQNKI